MLTWQTKIQNTSYQVKLFNEHTNSAVMNSLQYNNLVTQYNEIDNRCSAYDKWQKHWTDVLVCFCAGYSLQKIYQDLFATRIQTVHP